MSEFARVELEFNVGWIATNPENFSERFERFFKDHSSDDWTIESKVRPGYLTLIAIHKRL
jgi:hypothetical protein|nr:MAG TPA: hypothetical protein [Caudoviricetes sp.]